MTGNLKRAALAAGAALALMPGLASAVNCTDSIVTDDTAINPSYVSCTGSFSGNTTNGTISFDGVDYDFIGKTGNDNSGDGPFGGFGADVKSGTLTFDQAWSGTFVVALKAGNAYSLYQFSSATGVDSISFDTLGVAVNARGIGLGLSHVSLYGGQAVAVPEPQTYAMLLAGLGVVGMQLRRRRRDA